MAQPMNFLVYCCLVNYFYYTKAFSIRSGVDTRKMITERKEINQEMDSVTNNNQVIDASARFHSQPPPPTLPQIPNTENLPNHHRKRVKRQMNSSNIGSSWLKYVWRERQFKIPQMWLTHIRNLWAVDPIGGKTCFDADIPYGSVFLVKSLLLDSLFPRIGKNQ